MVNPSERPLFSETRSMTRKTSQLCNAINSLLHHYCKRLSTFQKSHPLMLEPKVNTSKPVKKYKCKLCNFLCSFCTICCFQSGKSLQVDNTKFPNHHRLCQRNVHTKPGHLSCEWMCHSPLMLPVTHVMEPRESDWLDLDFRSSEWSRLKQGAANTLL